MEFGLLRIQNPEVCYYFEFIQITNILTSSEMSSTISSSSSAFVATFCGTGVASGKQENDEGFRSYASGIVAAGDEVGL